MRAEELELGDYVEIARRRWVSVAVVVAVAVGFAVLYSAIATPQYRTTAQVLIADSRVQSQLDLSTSSAANARERDLRNEVEFARSNRVEQRAESELDRDIVVSVTPASDADSIQITVSGPDAQLVAETANVFAEAYIGERVAFVTEGYLDAAAVLEERLAEVQIERLVLTEQIASGEVDLLLGGARDRALLTEEEQLLLQLNSLRVVDGLAGVGVAQLNRRAEVPKQPISPNFVRNVALAAAVGLIGGAALALARETLSDTLTSRRDLAAAAAVPLLGAIPAIPAKRRGGRSRGKKVERMPIMTSAPAAFAEGFRSLRSSLALVMNDRDFQVLAVTSANPGEGKSTASLNLAAAMAQTGLRVLLIDADLRSPSLHGVVGVNNTNGLAGFIATEASFDVVTEEVTGRQLFDFLPAGKGSRNAADLLANGRFATMLDKLRGSYDLIVVDTAPVLPLSDTQLMLPDCDGVLFVARADQTNTTDVHDGLEQIERTATAVVGTVLTFANDRGDRYGYGYGYGTRSA